MSSDNIFCGMRVVQHPLAREIRTEFKVQRLHGNRRRKRWFVQRVEIKRPGCFVMGDGTVLMHPDLFAKLKEGVRHG